MNVPLPEGLWLLPILAVTITAGILFWCKVVLPAIAFWRAGRFETDDEGDDDD